MCWGQRLCPLQPRAVPYSLLLHCASESERVPSSWQGLSSVPLLLPREGRKTQLPGVPSQGHPTACPCHHEGHLVPGCCKQERKLGRRRLFPGSLDSGEEGARSPPLLRYWGGHKQKHPLRQMFGKEAKHAALLLLGYASQGSSRVRHMENKTISPKMFTLPEWMAIYPLFTLLPKISFSLLVFFSRVLFIKK